MVYEHTSAKNTKNKYYFFLNGFLGKIINVCTMNKNFDYTAMHTTF